MFTGPCVIIFLWLCSSDFAEQYIVLVTPQYNAIFAPPVWASVNRHVLCIRATVYIRSVSGLQPTPFGILVYPGLLLTDFSSIDQLHAGLFYIRFYFGHTLIVALFIHTSLSIIEVYPLSGADADHLHPWSCLLPVILGGIAYKGGSHRVPSFRVYSRHICSLVLGETNRKNGLPQFWKHASFAGNPQPPCVGFPYCH